MKSYQTYSKYFPYGLKTFFDIPVLDIYAPPASLGVRAFNVPQRDGIREAMIAHPFQEPMVADVMPYNMKKERGRSIKGKSEQQMRQDIANGKYEWIAISGQHSAIAAKGLVEATDKNSTDDSKRVAEHLKMRRCQIVDPETPRTVCVDLSDEGNASHKIFGFSSTYFEKLQQARQQYKAMNRPERPRGNRKTKDFQVSIRSCRD